MLYSLLDLRGTDAGHYILTAIIAHFVGLFTCGLFVKSQAAAKSMTLGGMGLCLAATVPSFSSPALWMGGLIVSGYFSGCAVAARGFFLRTFTPKNERMKSCADVLIYSNLLMIAVNVIAMNRSAFIGLSLSMLCLVLGMVLSGCCRQSRGMGRTKCRKTIRAAALKSVAAAVPFCLYHYH